MEGRDARGHYEELAAEYDEHWVYGPDYIPWMSGRMTEVLRLGPTDRIADIGSGTGLFAREVAKQLQPRHPILCVDPSEAMLGQLRTPPPAALTPIVASAEDIAEGRTHLPYEQLDVMWLKESVHHVADPAHTLRGLVDRLAPSGRLLVVMLPATIQYPLFEAALARFEERHPDHGPTLDAKQVMEMTKQISKSEHSYGLLHEGMNYVIMDEIHDRPRKPEGTLTSSGYAVGFMEEARYNALKGDQHDYTWDKAWSYHTSGALLNFIPVVAISPSVEPTWSQAPGSWTNNSTRLTS
ncbi:class I SAM-dependent methyltransferase [Streptomyces sp. NPDC058086]|uniref:class I SAM-dependent methyltransferase n=1 Tax=Streptomyces sp. NPDC058086 TaxID=3346334 RepID=UPI0036EA6CA5